MAERRRNREDPPAVARFGWRYHHLGIPHSSPRDGELHLKKLGVHVCGFETCPYGVEWMRFDTHCQVPEIVKTVPHLGVCRRQLGDRAPRKADPHSTELAINPGCGVAFILDEGAPIELLEFAPDSD
jgi:hypothetical protein